MVRVNYPFVFLGLALGLVVFLGVVFQEDEIGDTYSNSVEMSVMAPQASVMRQMTSSGMARGVGMSKVSGGGPERMLANADAMQIESDEGMPSSPDTSPPRSGERMIIRNGNINIIVESVPQARERIVTLVQSKKGYIASTNDYGQSSSLTVHVPVGDFDEVMAFVRNVAKSVQSESSSGDDVTQQFVDTEARAKNLETVHKQLLKLMEKANQVQDILAVQRELTHVTEQMEVHKSRMQYLSRNAAMSTIVINLSVESTPWTPQPEPIFTFDMGNTVFRALRSLGRFISGILTGIVFVSVLAIPIGVVLFCVVLLLRALDARFGLGKAIMTSDRVVRLSNMVWAGAAQSNRKDDSHDFSN